MLIHRWAFSLVVTCGVTTLVAIPPASGADPKTTSSSDGIPVESAFDPNNPNRVREAAARVTSSNNLKQIAIAVHSYHDAVGFLPHQVTNKEGKPLLSWRVQMLPYLEQDNLYKQFKLNEPWDSDHNIKLLEQMPKVFDSPRVTVAKKGYTVYQGFAGKGALFEEGKRHRFANLTDGTSNTLMVVESSSAVPWTKPADLPFDVAKELPAIGKAYDDRPLGAMCDGSVRVLDMKKILPATFKAAITVAGGEVLGKDW